MKISGIILSLVAAFIAASCSEGRKTVSQPDETGLEEELQEPVSNVVNLPRGAEALFDDFFFYFATNEPFQRSRIQFPLAVDGVGEQDSLITDSLWKQDRFFFDSGEYTLILRSLEQLSIVNDTSVKSAVVEKLFLKADSVSRYSFTKSDGRWTLDGLQISRVSRHPEAAFLRFYKRFCTDSVFRQRSMAPEIVFTGPDPDDDFAQMEGFITPDSWEAFAPVLPQDTLFNIIYGDMPADETRQRIFVIRGIDDEEDIELTFSNERGRWLLTSLTE
ncbi:MAG: DUF4348 domain-containing protein [Prevotella sp.]|nr:DUF4348 domain-containing protein [Prevotella sp.]